MESVKTTVRILYNGKIKEKDIELRSFSIGRSAKDTITIDSERVSRTHLKVRISSGEILICNNHATNGTFLNGTALPQGKWYKFKDGGTINLGSSAFDIQLITKNNVVPIKPTPPTSSTQVLKQTRQDQPIEKPAIISNITPKNNNQAASAISFSLEEDEDYEETVLKSRIEEPAPVTEVSKKEQQKRDALELLEDQSKQLLDQEYKELEEHLEQLYEKEKTLDQNVKEYEEKLAGIEEKLSESKQDLEDLDDNLIHTHEKFLEQDAYLKNKQSANKELIKEIAEKREEHEKLAEKLEKDNTALEQLHTDLKHSQAQLDKTHRQIDELKNEQSELDEEITILKKQKEDLELHTHQQNILIDRQQRETTSYERQIESTLEQLKYINEREANASQRVSELNQNIKSLENTKDSYTKDIQLLNAETEATRSKLIELECERDKTSSELQKCKQNLESSKQEIVLQAQKEIDLERENFKTEIQDLKNIEALALDEKKQEAEKILSDAREELEAAESEYKSTQDEIKNLNIQNHNEITTAKKEAENEVKLLKKSAQDKADQIELNAREKESTILESAKQKAQEELERQKNNGEMLVRQAEVRSQHIQNDGQVALQKIKEALSNDIARLRQEKDSIQEQADASQRLLDTLNESYEQKERELQNDLDNKDKEIQEKMAHAKERNIEKMNADINQKKEEKLQELNDQLQKTRQELEDEKSRARENLAKMRANELEQIRKMRAYEKAEIQRNKNENIDALSEGIEFLLKNEISTAQKKNLSLSEFYIQTDHIKDLVKESITTDQRSSKPIMDKLNPYGLVMRGKSVQVTRNILIGSTISFFLILSLFIFPTFYSGISQRVSSVFTVDQTAEDLFIQDLRKLRKQQEDLQLDKTPQYKDSYVDNILYTTDFEQIWLSDNFYKKWVVKLDEVASMELGLRESVMMEFISLEFRLMQELIKLRASTTRDLFDKHLLVMRDLEKKKRAEMIEVLGGKDILDYILVAQKRSYDNFIKSNSLTTK